MKKQNLLIERCPVCKKISTIVGWIEKKKDKVVSERLPEGNCPDCLLEITKGAIVV